MSLDPIDRDTLAKRTEFLRKIELFSGLAPESLKRLAESLTSRKYKKMDIIFHQGDDSHSLYLIVKGKVRIYRISPGGEETSFRIFSEKDMIGEFAAIDGQPRLTTARAMEDCVLIELDRSKFLAFVEQMPALSLGLIRYLVDKLRWTTNFAENIVRYDAKGRLLHIILEYNELFGKEIKAGKVYELELCMNQEDLASLVGARREWINRILQQWRKRGLLHARHGRITILDLPAVKEERNRRMELYGENEEW